MGVGCAPRLANKARMNSARSIEAARQSYAEELRFIAAVRSPAVIAAFASVPRERFVGPGPWRILSAMFTAEYWTTEDADARHVYHDVLIALDESRRLNNGQPSLWAFLYDQLGLAPGSHVMHVGAGTGYYTAILAEIVGETGAVTALEVDPGLAGQARANLAPWKQATLIEANGFDYRPARPADAIIVSAGVNQFSRIWIDALAEDSGRLLVPLTASNRWGGALLVTRRTHATAYPVRHLTPVGFIHCVGGRDPDADARLKAALSRAELSAVQSLRLAPEEPDETCWLAGDGWWLSTAAAS
jgi:protein-L-isoaspartate(D-aspartate) O-methyltransferase